MLYIATTNRISTLVISGRGQGQPPRTLEDKGCDVGCMTTDKETRDIIVARHDAIYHYGPHGRGPSYAFESPKKLVRKFKDYVTLVCPPKTAQMTKGGIARRFGSGEMDEIFNTSTFTLLDTDLKFNAHSETFTSQIQNVFAEWDELYVVTLEGKVGSRGFGNGCTS